MKKIIHIDADCFYAAVEIREDPSLSGTPVAVGGNPGRRGVISTCNYEARKYGVHSAMASAYALRLCPSLKIVRPNITLYREISDQMRDIFHDYTNVIEPLSLDEAYLDVSGVLKCRGSATLIAKEIKQRILDKTGITVSAGVAPLKFLAKIASDWQKPDGLFIIAPESVKSFIYTLPVNRLPGVGRVTHSKLSSLGLTHCGDILEAGNEKMAMQFGSFGHKLFRMASGVDDRAIHSSHSRKSLSVERTYANDIGSLRELACCLTDLLQELSRRYERLDERYVTSKRFVKVKFDDFSRTTMEAPISISGQLFDEDEFKRLLHVAWARQKRPVRLLGVGFRVREQDDTFVQLPLPFG